ncbi:MAG: hypothetical protein Q4C46_01880 [Bacillota bacterium]|nr:hypothetical protein [Bacillota bacterium]
MEALTEPNEYRRKSSRYTADWNRKRKITGSLENHRLKDESFADSKFGGKQLVLLFFA